MRESNHYGASGYWARLPVRHGMAGFAVTNASASIAPWGGTQPVVGNNPPAWAVPVAAVPPAAAAEGGASGADGISPVALAGDGPIDAVFLDMALSVVAGNRLDIYARRGQPIPPGWALDAEGQPTTDARARQKGGTYAPVAEYKGFGMALLFSLFTSLLAGGPFDYEMLGQGAPNERCHWFLAFDIGQVVPLEEFTRRVQAVSERVRSTRTKAGVERLVVPGDLERERVQRQLREGLQLEPFIVADLRSLAGELRIALTL
jgi:LDH2 family malate/lactate/ureidoglycolate dehydrogenase